MNKTTAIAILSALIIGVIMGSQIGCNKLTTGSRLETIHTDTLIHFLPRHDTVWSTVTQTNSVPHTIWGHDTVIVHHIERINGHDTVLLTSYQALTDTVAYADTLRQRDAFMAELFDTISGNRILSRRIRWADVSPIEEKTVTNTVMKKPTLVKAYLGVDAYGGKSGLKYNLDIAPAASLVFADRYMVDLGYYIFNQEVTAGLKVKLSFGKK